MFSSFCDIPCTCALFSRSSCRTYHAGGVCCAGVAAAALVDLHGSVFTPSSCVCRKVGFSSFRAISCTCAPHSRSSCHPYHGGAVRCVVVAASLLVVLPGSVFTPSSGVCVCVCMLKQTRISILPACKHHIRVQRSVRKYVII